MSIYSYDKEARCDWCVFGEKENDGFICTKGYKMEECNNYKYDVFKRKPNQSPKFQTFTEDDFSIR